MIKENYLAIKEDVEKTAKKSRFAQDVTLIAVSKTHPVSEMMEAYEAGARDFGENKVQELMDKIPEMPSDIRWHMIGHLQRNKVKYLIGKVVLIHSVDSLRLAEEINKESEKAGVTTDILIEVNIAQEDTKFGTGKEEAIELVKAASKLPNIRIRGLMTIAPYTEDPEENRVYFSDLKNLSIDINALNIDNISMDFLSMGMSGDFIVAIEEGANFVRVGSKIFGPRNYTK